MLRAVGAQLYDGATPVRLNGVNDTTVLGHLMEDLTLAQKRYDNHNLPNYTGDSTTIIPATSDQEFWYKYFWLLGTLGTDSITSTDPNHPYTGPTHINHLRVGGHDGWGRGTQYHAFTQHRALCDQAMLDMLDMAEDNGIYVNITMGGNPATDSNFGTGDLFSVGTNAFNNYVEYCAQYILAYGNHPAIACFNLFNEPDYNAFKTKYGYAIQPDGYEAWESEMMYWKATLLGNVKARLAQLGMNPTPLITIAVGNYTVWWATWPGHDQADIDYEKQRAVDWSVNDDLIVGHPYASSELDQNFNWHHQTMVYLNKPGYTEEYGYNGPTSYYIVDNNGDGVADEFGHGRRNNDTMDVWYSYWTYLDLSNAHYGVNSCVMVLWGWPAEYHCNLPLTTGNVPDVRPAWMFLPAPNAQYQSPQPDYPGYPISQATMDAAEDAWITYSEGGGDVPYPLPNKLVTLSIVKDGVTLINAQGITNPDGQVTFEYTPQATGDYIANGSFAGDVQYAPSSGQTGFTVVNVAPPPVTPTQLVQTAPASSSVNYTTGTLTYTIQLRTLAGTPIIGKTLAMYLDGVLKHTATDTNDGAISWDIGSANITYTPGAHTWVGVFSGDATYGPSETVPLTVNIAQSTIPTAIALTGSGATPVNVTKTLTATLTRTSDNALLIGAVLHTDLTYPNGTHYTQDYTTDANGQVITTFTPAQAGSYVYTVSYSGNSQYDPSNATVSFTVTALKQTRMVILAPATNPFTYVLGTSCPFRVRLEYTNDGANWIALSGKTLGLYRSTNTLPVVNAQTGYNQPAGEVVYDIGSPPMTGYTVGDHRFWTWKFAGDATYAAVNSPQQYLDVV